jgi:hypothetical protein
LNVPLKIKAVILVVLIVISLFSITVFAQEEPKVCCEKTKSGESCLYTEESNCAEGSRKASATCSQTSYCKLGCCFSSLEGNCYKSTPRTTCNERNATWTDSQDCAIEDCQKGCCVLSSECSFITKTKCRKFASLYPDLEMSYDPSILTELDCTNQCRSAERGACVSADSNCVFTTRENCQEQNSPDSKAGFYRDKLCSADELSTICEPQKTTGCLPDKDEVYWFDGCGNPENIYSSDKVTSYNNGNVLPKESSCTISGPDDPNCGNCNYAQATLCSKAPNDKQPTHGEFSCKDLKCKETFSNDASPSTQSKNKKLGESWCVYDAAVGYGKDVVGSRHYRHLCINGEEITEPCKDFREEMCIQGVSGDSPYGLGDAFFATGNYVEARCRENRWSNCRSYTNPEDCENIGNGDCFWLKAGLITAEDSKQGTCAPHVPPGLRFWEAGPTPEQPAQTLPLQGNTQTTQTGGTGICSSVNSECTVTWEIGGVKKIFGGDAKDDGECIQNCECLTDEWVTAVHTTCKTSGDCGAYFNVIGKFTDKGFETDSPGKPKFQDWNTLITQPESCEATTEENKEDSNCVEDSYTFTNFLKSSALSLFIIAGSGAYAGYLGGFGAIKGGIFANPIGAISKTETLTSTAAKAFPNIIPKGDIITITAENQAKYAGILQKGGFNKINAAGNVIEGHGFQAGDTFNVGEKFIAKEDILLEGSAQGGQYIQWVNTVAWLWTAYNLVDWLLADTASETYSAQCLPWQAPIGGQDCEKCNSDDTPCSEYKCKSLGQLCSLLNPGTGNETCINMNPNDATTPIISPLEEVIPQEYTIKEGTEEGIRGYFLNPDVPPFTRVALGIETNEPSQCKLSLEHSKTFDEMAEFFGDSLFSYKHVMEFALPSELTQTQILRLTNGGKYSLYVRCQDGSGNKNQKDYFIKFNIARGPDTTPPVIELTSIANNAFVASNVNKTDLDIYLNEPSECRFSNVDTSFNNMNSTFTCATNSFAKSPIYYGLYKCSTTLPIQQKGTNNFFFRCKDQPINIEEKDRNVNEESFKFSLTRTIPLKIRSIEPEGTLYTSELTLKVITDEGAENGKAICGFSEKVNLPLEAKAQFLNTGNSSLHTQPLTLGIGDFTYYVECIDAGGNIANITTKFKTSIDTSPPKIIELFKDDDILHITMDEKSKCEYAPIKFSFEEGTQMTGSEKDHELTITDNLNRIYILCQDSFNNLGTYIIYP